MNWLLRWVVSGIALALVARIPGLGVEISGGILPLVVATVIIGLLNAFVRPILALLTLPLNCLTFGLFGFVLNAILFYAADVLAGDSFNVKTTLGYFAGPIIMGIISGILNSVLIDKKKE